MSRKRKLNIVKKISTLFSTLVFLTSAFSQTDNNLKTLSINQLLVPQMIDYDGKPELEYLFNNETIALDAYDDNDNTASYIRMKLNGEEVKLKMQKQLTSKLKRVYSNRQYTVTYYEIIFGDCAGEGAQNITGKLLIQNNTHQNTILFHGFDVLYSSKKFKDVGNGQ